MLRRRIAILGVALAASIIAVPVGAVRAQCGGAYTDEMAGADGSYESTAECGVDGGTVGVGIDGMPDETTVSGRDNRDAPPVDRDTATFEGERERVP
jgi:hypothetical protein